MARFTLGSPFLLSRDGQENPAINPSLYHYPAVLLIENHTHLALMLPSVGCQLTANGNTNVRFESGDQLMRFVTDIKQVADTNKFKQMLTIDDGFPVGDAGNVNAGEVLPAETNSEVITPTVEPSSTHAPEATAGTEEQAGVADKPKRGRSVTKIKEEGTV